MTVEPGSDAAEAGRTLVIPLFIPHLGCPHQCVFCNQTAITGKAAQLPSVQQVRQEVARFLRYAKKKPATTQISFYGGNFLGLKKEAILHLLGAVMPFIQAGVVDGIRFSTRPDTVNPEMLDLLDRIPVAAVELGVQSMNDRVLDASGRGHRSADTVRAAELLKKRDFQLGLQMMVGLPADTDAGAMETASRISALEADFVRIYPTLVLKGSALARRFRAGAYHPMPLAACVTLVKRLYLFFNAKHIPVVRMGLQSSDGLTGKTGFIAGPYHPAFGHLVHAEIALDAVACLLKGLRKLPDPLTIAVHPAIVSRVQGLNKNNLRHLKRTFGLSEIVLLQDRALATNHLSVADHQIALP